VISIIINASPSLSQAFASSEEGHASRKVDSMFGSCLPHALVLCLIQETKQILILLMRESIDLACSENQNAWKLQKEM
jgi:hypothetical protein